MPLAEEVAALEGLVQGHLVVDLDLPELLMARATKLVDLADTIASSLKEIEIVRAVQEARTKVMKELQALAVKKQSMSRPDNRPTGTAQCSKKPKREEFKGGSGPGIEREAPVALAGPGAVPDIPAQRMRQLSIIKVPLRDCFARVDWGGIWAKPTIGTEEGSMKALRMESGGAQHYFRANEMFEYLYLNKGFIEEDRVVTIIVPGVADLLVHHGLLQSAPVLEWEPVKGTTEYEMFHGLSEYRVSFSEYDAVYCIARRFYSNVLNGLEFRMGRTCDDAFVPIVLTFDPKRDFLNRAGTNLLDLKEVSSPATPQPRKIHNVTNWAALEARPWKYRDEVHVQDADVLVRMLVDHTANTQVRHKTFWMFVRGPKGEWL